MGFFDKAVNTVKSVGGQVGKTVFGGGDDPGLLGTGQFKSQKYDINEKAFNDSANFDKRRAEFAQQLAQSQNRQGAQLNMDPSNQVRGMQLGLANQLQAQSLGQGPSLATMQLQQATDRNLAQAAALAASGRGGAQGGLGLRQVQNQQSQIASQAARDAATARMQEQLNAQGALGGVLNSTRGSDVSLASTQAQLQQEQNALNDNQSRFLMGQQSELDQKQREALMALEKLKTDQQIANEQNRAGSFQATSKARGDMVSGIGSGIAAAFSDKRLKKNIKDGGKEVDKFMKNYAEGGEVEGDDKSLNKFLSGWSVGQDKAKEQTGTSGHYGAGKAMGSGIGALMKKMGKEDLVAKSTMKGVDTPTTGIMPKENMSPDTEMYAACGGEVPKMSKGGEMSQDKMKAAFNAMSGGVVPGKAKVAGDSVKNDTVDAKVSPGEIILPRTVAQSGDESKVMDFLAGIKPEMYNYKDKKHGEGTYVSPMAQDLEKTELGKDMVIDTPEGKMVDYARAAGTLMAAQSNLHKRLAELEAKKGKK
jgi:hypothetical protein